MNIYLASLGPALADHLWQSTAFAAAAWLLTILLRKNSARIRYGLWLAASVKFLIPFSFLIALGGLLPKPAQSVAPAVYTAMQVTEQPFADFSLAAANSSVQTLTLTQRFASDIPAILLALWLAGVATVLMIWFVRWRRASVCLLDAVPAVKGRELDILRNLEMRQSSRDRAAIRVCGKSRLQSLYRNSDSVISAAQATSRCAPSAPETADRPATGTRTEIAARKPAPLGAADDSPARQGWVPEPKTPSAVGAAQIFRSRSPLGLKLSPQQTEPSLYGILRPVLVWPEQLSDRLSDEQIEAIMTHELAHARRFDNATAALHMLVEAVFWFHPLMWWMERRMIAERERACDETVAALGGSPDAYAEGILETCRFCVAPAMPCVSGITGADLRNRVLSIMKAPARMRMTWPKKLLIGAAALCAVATPVLLGQLRDNAALLLGMPAAQQSQQTGSLRFEVAAIKPGRAPESGMNFRSSRVGTTFRLENMPLRQLVEMAFSVSDYALKAPAWLSGQRFDIEAKIPAGGPFSQKDVDEMWLNLLIDRFGMKWHEAQGSASGYELVSGQKLLLKPSEPADRETGARSRGPTLIAGHDMPMSDLATALGEVLGAPVIDNTRISGGFDVNLIWRPDDDQLAADMAKRMNVSVDDLPSTVFLALQEQAGLKLRRAEVPSRIVVVDDMNRQPNDGFQVPPQPAPTADWEKAADGKMAFSVASVKPDSAPMNQDTVHANVSMGPGDYFNPTGGLFRTTDFPLSTYISFAYKLSSSDLKALHDQLPKWATDARYDIEARSDRDATKDQMRLMTEAFGFHHTYALVLAKSGKTGPQLSVHPKDAPCSTVMPGPGAPGTIAGGLPATRLG